MEPIRPPLSFLDGLFDRFATTFQPPAWLVDEVQHRGLLLFNHVLMQEPQAQARLMRQKGSVVRVEWRQFSLALEVTPAGLLDRLSPADAAARKPDLLLGVAENSPTALAQTALRGDKPPIKIEGDVQLAALERGEIDAGVLLHSPGFVPASLASLPVAEEPLVLALPAAHPLATARRLSAAQVLAQPLVLFPRRILPSIADALFALYHAHGQSPQVAQEAIQMQTIVNLVAAGLGVAWVPRSVTRFERSGVVYREWAQAGVPRCETRLVWAQGEPPPALARFVGFVREQAQSPAC